MKKILLILLLTIFFIPNVNAAESDYFIDDDPLQCFGVASPSSNKNILNFEWSKECGYVNYHFRDYTGAPGTEKYYCIDNFIEVEPDTTYTLSHYDNNFSPIKAPTAHYMYFFDKDFKQLDSYGREYFQSPKNLTTKSDAKYFLYCTYRAKEPNNIVQLEKGEITTKEELSYVPYEEYVAPPEPMPLPADTTLDTFYSIYLDKLSTATTYAIENKFLLGMIGVILSFIILELVLNLFRNGGYRP